MARSMSRFLLRLRHIGSPNYYSKETNWCSGQKQWLSGTSSNYSRFIPLSSKTLFKKLMNENGSSHGEFLKMFEKFAVGVDVSLTNENISSLPEIKLLYGPLNPDVGTTTYKNLQWEELLDREFWFLQKFSSYLDKSGFQEIDASHLKKCFAVRPVGKGVVADVEPQKFEVLRCWVLSDIDIQTIYSWKPFMQHLGFLFEEGPSNKLFKRVIIATRLKKEDKLSLRLFKDIPSNQLHLLLPPTGGLKMDESYCKLLYVTSGISGLFLLSRSAVTWLVGSNHHLGYLPISFSAFFGIVGVALWTNFKQRQKRYLTDIIEVMYNRFIIGNHNLLAVVADKVQEEALKGILITYFFLLHNDALKENKITDAGLPVRSRINAKILENKINSWIKSQTGEEVTFNIHDSLTWLLKMGLVEIDPNTDELMPSCLPDALKILPVPGQHSPSSHFTPIKIEEFDLFYGDLAEATNLERKDFGDMVTSAVLKQLNKFQRKL